MIDAEFEEVLAEFRAMPSFDLTLVRLGMQLLVRDDRPMFDEIRKLRLRPTDDVLPDPEDSRPWRRLRACVSDAEHTSWVRLAFMALEAGDGELVARINELIERRSAN